MKNLGSLMLALTSLSVIVSIQTSAATFAEDFSSDPVTRDWRVFGDTNLFQWDSTNRDLRVTWDSARPNSYFYHPLETIVTREDDFSFAFDLLVSDIISGNEPGKTGGLEIGIGFLNLADATGANFMRGVFGGAPNVVEFDYYPAGYFAGFGDVAATTAPAFISRSGFAYAPATLSPYVLELPTNQVIHVFMAYTGADQTLVMSVTTNGVPLAQFPKVILSDTNSSAFASSDDFRVGAFSVSSYSSAGDDYDSVLAHGIIRNIVVTVPPAPVQNPHLVFSGGAWQLEFTGQVHWVYTLERTTDFESWMDVSPETTAVSEPVILSDASAASGHAFYRVRANRP